MNSQYKIFIIFTITLTALTIFGSGKNVPAEIYFYFDAENNTAGDVLPHHQSSGPNFCQPECGSSNTDRGYIANSVKAPQGNNYFEWYLKAYEGAHSGADSNILNDPTASWPDNSLLNMLISNQTTGVDGNSILSNTSSTVSGLIGTWHDGDRYRINWGDSYNQVKNENFPIDLNPGDKLYLAYYMRFDRINEKDIWYEGTATQSADKGVELYSPTTRIVTSRGQWDNYIPNADHHYTVWGGSMKGNPSYTFYQNLNGYGLNNPIQLQYEMWYSVVAEIEFNYNNLGSFALWINGIQIEQTNNVNTTDETCNPYIERIQIDGTIAQPAYDAPAHYRKYDALILTDNWQDIISGGYLKDPESDDTTAPYAPGNLKAE